MRNLIPRGTPFISQTETSSWPSTIHDKRRLNPRTYTQFIPPPCYKGSGGRGGGWNPYLQFLICCSISKRFCLQWKAFALLNKIRYILLVVALLEACDGINNGRHFGRHFLFIQVKTSINDHFLFLTCKIIHK